MTDHDLIFYDADCGFCQRWVMFVLSRDSAGRFQFAPRSGVTFEKTFDASICQQMPSSVVVLTHDKRVLLRSSAVLHIMRELGGTSRVLAQVAGVIPAGIRDFFYDSIARIRRRLIRPTTCAPLGADQQSRFLP